MSFSNVGCLMHTMSTMPTTHLLVGEVCVQQGAGSFSPLAGRGDADGCGCGTAAAAAASATSSEIVDSLARATTDAAAQARKRMPLAKLRWGPSVSHMMIGHLAYDAPLLHARWRRTWQVCQ